MFCPRSQIFQPCLLLLNRHFVPGKSPDSHLFPHSPTETLLLDQFWGYKRHVPLQTQLVSIVGFMSFYSLLEGLNVCSLSFKHFPRLIDLIRWGKVVVRFLLFFIQFWLLNLLIYVLRVGKEARIVEWGYMLGRLVRTHVRYFTRATFTPPSQHIVFGELLWRCTDSLNWVWTSNVGYDTQPFGSLSLKCLHDTCVSFMQLFLFFVIRAFGRS